MARTDIMFGSGDFARKRAAEMADSTVNRTLGSVELARLKMLQGDFAGSSAILAPQIDELFTETELGPVLKKGAIAGNVLAGTVGDDRAIPYELPAYEMLFGLQYQALNSLFLGEQDNARVYLRRATSVQEQLKEEKAEQPESSADASDSEADGAIAENSAEQNVKNADEAAGQIAAKLSPVADAVRSSYENALVWYLMGLFLSKEDDSGNAEIAYREAGKICPAIMQFANPPSGVGRDVIVIYEEDLVDMREPIKIPLPFGGTVWSVDFPVYNAPARMPSQVAVEVGGKLSAMCVPAVNVQALAYRDLRDRIPGIAMRNVTRAAVKIAAQQVANHVNTGSAADVVLMAGVLAYNAISTAVSEADTRAWQTLPEHVQIARLRIPSGQNCVTLRNPSTGRSCEIAIPAEPSGTATHIVWVTDVRGFATAGVVTVGGSAVARPTWSRTVSLLHP